MLHYSHCSDQVSPSTKIEMYARDNSKEEFANFYHTPTVQICHSPSEKTKNMCGIIVPVLTTTTETKNWLTRL